MQFPLQHHGQIYKPFWLNPSGAKIFLELLGVHAPFILDFSKTHSASFRDLTATSRLADRLLEIYHTACRVQRDGRLNDLGRKKKVAVLEGEVCKLCGSTVRAKLPPSEGPANDYRLLCEELIRLTLDEQLFTFVTAEPVEQPNGKTMVVPGTNNESERTLRSPAQARDTGRTNKAVPGARRQTVIVSVLESLRLHLVTFTWSAVIEEARRWGETGRSCFARLAEKLGLPVAGTASNGRSSLLDRLLSAPDG
jgi:transposase